MKDWQLSKTIASTKSDAESMSYLFDEVVQKIEDLEDEIDTKDKEIETLQDEITELKERIAELESGAVAG